MDKFRKGLHIIGILLAIGYIGYGVLGLTGVIGGETLAGVSEELKAASAGLDETAIDARMNADKRSLSVTQTLKLTNRTGQSQNAVMLRTWPNAFQSVDTSPCAAEESRYAACYPNGFSSGALVMSRALVGEVGGMGEPVVYRYLDDAKTLLSVPVPGGWQEGENVAITLSYVLQMPEMAYRFGVWEGSWALGNAFVTPAIWEDGKWRSDAYPPVGDPFVSDCMNYTVNVVTPEGYLCAGSGEPAVSTANGLSSWQFHSLAVRDFALVITNRYARAEASHSGVRIAAYADSTARAKEMAGYAKKALACYEELYGSYPYPSYTLAQVSFPDGGMEYPMLSMISTKAIEEGGRELEYLIAHETAHQWWYAVVGSDGWRQPWQDEALCEYSLLDYAEKAYGRQERLDLEYARAESAMRVTVPAGIAPGSPLDAYASMSQYVLLAYNRGLAALCALDRTVPGGLNAFLRDYYATFAFGRATRADFEAQLAKSTGEDLAPLLRDYLDTHILN